MNYKENQQSIIIFGASGTGQKIYNQLKDSMNVLCFIDNNQDLWGKYLDGLEIKNPEDIKNIDFNRIYVGSMCGIDEITEQLMAYGIPSAKIVRDIALVQVRSRILFLKRAAELILEKNISGAVAEAGVYQGEFAKEINLAFPLKKLYLFDTFSGFPDQDIAEEQETSITKADYLKDTSVEKVISRMTYKEQCVICKGYFPQTTKGITSTFCFVSLDMDLYKPTLEGLRFFYPRLEKGGMIVLHDYFSDAYPNVKTAVTEYQKELGISLNLCPVGDDLSIAIIK